MFQHIINSAKALAFYTVVLGALYPLLITGIGGVFFPWLSSGSLVQVNGQVVGSMLIAQNAASPKYFSPRPSASDFATLPSGASNDGPTSERLHRSIEARAKIWGDHAPADLLMASGSGLDPDISREAAQMQIPMVARARNLSAVQEAALRDIVDKTTRRPTLGVFGMERVNVLELNLALDRSFR